MLMFNERLPPTVTREQTLGIVLIEVPTSTFAIVYLGIVTDVIPWISELALLTLATMLSAGAGLI